MKRRKSLKLQLSRETLRSLDAQQLHHAGGAGQTDMTCALQGCPPTFGQDTCVNCPESQWCPPNGNGNTLSCHCPSGGYTACC